jgi:hypothetical protein
MQMIKIYSRIVTILIVYNKHIKPKMMDKYPSWYLTQIRQSEEKNNIVLIPTTDREPIKKRYKNYHPDNDVEIKNTKELCLIRK